MAMLTALAAAAAPFATALGIGSSIITGIGAIQSANSAAASSEYNAKIADRDAAVAEQNRKLTLDQARIDTDDARRNNRRALASVRASYGASGLDMTGSPLDVLEDTAIEQELDVRRISYEGTVRAREGALDVLGLTEGAALSRMEAKSRRTGGAIGAVGAVSSGVGQALTRMN